jgi:hypothetical protein
MAAVMETYDLMSRKYFIHATPTLFNAGTPRPQMSSCFLVHMKDDSIEGIFDTLKTCACISKYAGGIGLSIHNIRATRSHIRGTNGSSNGLVPMLKVFSDTARCAARGGECVELCMRVSPRDWGGWGQFVVSMCVSPAMPCLHVVGTLTRVAASARAPSLFTWSPGTRTSWVRAVQGVGTLCSRGNVSSHAVPPVSLPIQISCS